MIGGSAGRPAAVGVAADVIVGAGAGAGRQQLLQRHELVAEGAEGLACLFDEQAPVFLAIDRHVVTLPAGTNEDDESDVGGGAGVAFVVVVVTKTTKATLAVAPASL